MWKNMLILGIFDSLKGKNSVLKNYEKKLHEYQEHEADTLIDIGVLHLEDEQIEKALENFNEALKLYRKLEFPEGEAYTQNLIGDSYLTKHKLKLALNHYQKSFDIYYSIQSPLMEDIQEKINDIADLQEYKKSQTNQVPKKNIEDLKKQRKQLFDEIKQESVEDFENMVKIPDSESKININQVNTSSGKNKSEIDFESLSVKLEDVIKMLENVDMYDPYSNDDNPINYLKDAYLNAELIDDKTGKATIGLLIGDILLKKGETSKALKSFKDSFNIFHENKDQKGEALCLLLIGSVCYVLDDQKTMYGVFKKSLGIFKKLDDHKGESVAIELINTLYKSP
ncbi:MAG: tetratricopeptide repeat protein [Methanomicrobiales archaeon]